MSLSISKEGPFFEITAWPEGEETVPRVPFLQPGNYYVDPYGVQYRILRSTMADLSRNDGLRYAWVYVAEKDN